MTFTLDNPREPAAAPADYFALGLAVLAVGVVFMAVWQVVAVVRLLRRHRESER